MPEPSAPEPGKRAYHSLVRQRHAAETRQRILAASRALLQQRGYAGTTLEAIAEEAGVSVKTVVAAFGSKRRILAELVSPPAFGSRYQGVLAHLRAEPDPSRRVALVAQLTRQVYEALTPEFELLRGAGAVAPELAEVAHTVEQRRWHLQERFVAFLSEQGILHADRSQADATDEVWALTSFDLYRLLVRERGWTAERYEAWLTQALVQRLFQSPGDRSV